MKVEDCIVSVERRSLGGCLDLAFVFWRRFIGPITLLMLTFAVPATLLTWLLANTLRHDVLLPSLAIFATLQMLFSGALVAAVGPQVFGVQIQVRAALMQLLKRVVPYAFLGLLARSTGFCLVLPMFFVLAWCGHLPEVMFLERTELNSVTTRLSWLSKGGGYTRNVSRLFWLALFWVVLSFGIFVVIDLLAAVLFNSPIFSGSFGSGPDLRDELLGRLFDDPVFVTVLLSAFWLTAPILRLAWFFCYLDQRIRNECWDLDLQYRVEAVRLEGQMTAT